ncbi:MAG: Fe-Mn family superoxide dismutase [Patescibacteria group bacterium]
MKKFEELKFNIGELKGISKKTIEEHLKLYAGYVKNTNLILEKIPEYESYAKEDAFAPYAASEIQRRFAFEFDGMRNHEYYFKSLEGGAKIVQGESHLKKAMTEEWGSVDLWFARFKAIAMTRGIGWAILYYDPINKKLLNAWVDEQHLGHLTGLRWIFGIDMWEHSFYLDYATDKKKYIDAFLENVNWEVIEENFAKAK